MLILSMRVIILICVYVSLCLMGSEGRFLSYINFC